MNETTPGRPKGTKVTACGQCGRRVTGEPGARATCPNCGKGVTIGTRREKRASVVFLPFRARRKNGKNGSRT